ASLPALRIKASPASSSYVAASNSEDQAVICGKRCAGCRAVTLAHGLFQRDRHASCPDGFPRGAKADTPFAARGPRRSVAVGRVGVFEVGEASIRALAAGIQRQRYHAKRGDVEGPWVDTSTGGVSPLSLPTFFAAAKKVGAAPHRGNTSKPK